MNETIILRNRIINKYIAFQFTWCMGMIIMFIILTGLFPSFYWYLAVILGSVTTFFFGYIIAGLFILKKTNENFTIGKTVVHILVINYIWRVYRDLDLYFEENQKYKAMKFLNYYIYSAIFILAASAIVFLVFSAITIS